MKSLSELPGVNEVDCHHLDAVPPEVFQSDEPVLLKGLVSHWPAVAACGRSNLAATEYLKQFRSEQPVTVYVGDDSMGGRFFYNDAFTGFNFKSGTATLDEVCDKLCDDARPAQHDAIYVGSTPVDQWLPGFRAANDIAIPNDDVLVSFWLGSKTRISAHYDFPDNIACVVAGERRFTLLPPEQIDKLYIGPVDRTPSGQAISLVDFTAPDLDRFPLFAEAMEHARTCLTQPGDAVFIPSLWWHHIEALSPLNLLVNYWWVQSPAFMGSPISALMHAMLAVRDLPPRQRAAWQALFRHYVFEAGENVYEHIPEPGRGCLAPLNDESARRLRAELLNRLNR